MDWVNVQKVKKFTPINDFFNQFGKPLFKMGYRPVYYMGNGFIVSYSPRMFRVENNSRIEYGDEGEYALGMYYFVKKKDLEAHFKVKQEQYNFEGDELGGEIQIVDGISINSTYSQVASCFRQKAGTAYYQEGKTKVLIGSKFEFQNNYIIWGNYTFFFFGKSEKTKVSGFEVVFTE